MTKDEVIKGLEKFIADLRPFAGNHADWERVYAALALLKEEPRPLSLEDVLKIYHTLDNHVWPYNTPPYLWCEINRKMYDAFSGWVTWREVMSIIERVVTLRPYSIANYGELWTLYLRCPDKEDTKCET